MGTEATTTASRVRSPDGTEIAYFTTGQGPSLVVVHGAMADHTRFGVLLPYLEPHLTVHAMDRRGRGASGDATSYSLQLEYEDVAAVVDAVAEATGAAVSLYGHSHGGFAAFGAAALTPNLRKLVLYEGWPTPNPALLDFPPGVEGRIEEALARGDREAAVDIVFRDYVGLSHEEMDAVKAQASWPNRVAAAHTIAREIRAEASTPLDPAQAAKVTVPTMLVTGGDSGEVMKGDIEAVAAALPNARVEVIEGQQHIADVLAPDVFAARLLAFLRES